MTPVDRSGTILGAYRLDALLGRGGMGEVYRAHDLRRDRTVALKLLPAELARQTDYRDRFDRESRLAARLEHPHIVPIHDWGQIDDTLFLDMRLIRGHSLGDLLRAGPLAVDRSLHILGQIAGALDAAHAAGLIHRDVKPDNILVDESDFAYLVDFGIAQVVDDTRLTRAGGMVGSVAYMAPERFSDAPFDGTVDGYALTCVLFECLTGHPPFGRSDAPTVMRGHILANAPLTGSPLDPAISRGLAKDPRRRFTTCADIIAAAQAALSPTMVQVVPHDRYPQRPPAALPHRSRRPILVAAAILAVVVLTAAAVGSYLISHRHSDSVVEDAAIGTTAAVGTTAGVSTTACTFTTASTTSVRPTGPPASPVPNSGSTTLHLTTSTGDIDIRLDRAGAPCNSAAVETLAHSGFYENQGCARLSDYILMCAAGGAGPTTRDIQSDFEGPGWTSPNELPTGLPIAAGKVDSFGRQQVTYPRGAVLITNPGAQQATGVANGSSSFFIVITPTITAPLYTAVGSVTSGMGMIDDVARGGFAPAYPGANFGMPHKMPNLLTATVS